MEKHWGEGFLQRGSCISKVSVMGFEWKTQYDGEQKCPSCLLIQTVPRAARDGRNVCLALPLGVRWLLYTVNQLVAEGQGHVSNCSG